MTINGDVWVGKKVKFAGTVIIGESGVCCDPEYELTSDSVANEGNRIQIPDGTILENSMSLLRYFWDGANCFSAELVSGNLAVIDH